MEKLRDSKKLKSDQPIEKTLWLSVIISGIVNIAFGALSLIIPNTLISIFIYSFSLFIVIVAVIALAQSLTDIKPSANWWLSILFTLCGISIGVFTIFNPIITRALLPILLAVFIFIGTILNLLASSFVGKNQAKLPLVVIGIIGIIFGFIVLLQPNLSADSSIWLIGCYILLQGLVSEAGAWYLYNNKQTKGSVTIKSKDKSLDS